MYTDDFDDNNQYRITLPLFGDGSDMVESIHCLAYGSFQAINRDNSSLLAFGKIFHFVASEGTDPYIIEDCSVPKCGKKSDPSYEDQLYFIKKIRPNLHKSMNVIFEKQYKYSPKNLSNMLVRTCLAIF